MTKRGAEHEGRRGREHRGERAAAEKRPEKKFAKPQQKPHKEAAASSGTTEASSSSSLAPVIIKRVPSLRGKNTLALHAAGSFMRAPSPGKLPMPPPRWAQQREVVRPPATSYPPASTTSAIVPTAELQNNAHTVAQLHGNLLMLALAPRFPAERYGDLAGKIVGMLLEGLEPQEVGALVCNESDRNEYVREALEVLRDADDERASRAIADESRRPTATAPLQVDVGAAQLAARTDDLRTTGLTPALAASGLMRMSPRVSGSKYSTATILGGAGWA